MKAFWWFKEDSIAGMARPGFNSFRWLELPFHEALLMGWLGQHPPSSIPLQDLEKHIYSYGPKINKFLGVTAETFEDVVSPLKKRDELIQILKSLEAKTQAFKNFELSSEELHFELNMDQLQSEIDQLLSKKINTIITLNELHHNEAIMTKHFRAHHFSIVDLGPPTFEQASELAQVMKSELAAGHRMAVHCLAGIGRTSTMIMAAHILMGESPSEVEERLKRQNPYFGLSPSQRAFIEDVIKKCSANSNLKTKNF